MGPVVLASLLERPRPILLDGAVGTELARRGVRTTLPLWSARALIDPGGPETLAEIHGDYARAGAEILVTNTFRTTERALAKGGAADAWREVNRRAVECARAGAAAAPGPCLVAGGLAPLEDCYRPDLAPSREECLSEHRRQADLLAGLGVDLIFIETMNCRREALAALEAARASGLDVLLSLCPRPPHHLLSGEPLEEAVPEIADAGAGALRGILLNCATPEALAGIYRRFAALVTGLAPTAPRLPHGLYAHLGEPDPVSGWKLPERHEPERYAAWMRDRLDEGARLVGGCCGTTPDHTGALARLLERRA